MSDQISRADAIKAVEQEYRIDRGYMVDDYTYGFNQAIHYVSDIILPDLPSAETHEIRTETHACVKETHDTDLISRADAIEAVLTYFIPRSHTGERGEHEEDFVRTIFKALPSADTSSDLISRANAIRWVKTECNPYGKPTLDYDSGLKVIEHLKKMPSELPSAEAGWIPCSERLPEKDDLVLVTVWNDVTIAWRNIYGGWESAEDMYEKGDVIAWMPLPSPYREDGE